MNERCREIRVMVEIILSVLAGLLVAFILASLVEWTVHLLMHRRIFLSGVHYRHHVALKADGMLWEFLYYLPAAIIGSALFGWIGWQFNCPWFAGSVCAGSFLYALFAGYAHQVQHEHPELVFWMNPPVHTVHHLHEMHSRNFGIGVDLWDKIFGTYQRVDWQPDPARVRRRWRDYFQIQWY